MTRVLLTISRTWTKWSLVRETLATIHEKWPDAVLVHGAHPKCDSVAAGMWIGMGGAEDPHPAKWTLCGPECPRPKGHRRSRRNGGTYCPDAGFRRNEEMVLAGADLCVAFIRRNSGGATHCSAFAEAQGIHTHRFTDDTEEVAS